MNGQKSFTIFVFLEILLKYQVTNWWLKNLLMWSNEEADFFPEINKSFTFPGMGQQRRNKVETENLSQFSTLVGETP